MSMQIKKLLKVGDTVYSAQGGAEMTVTKIDNAGFETDQDYFLFSEVRKLYFLTKYGYWQAQQRRKDQR